MKTFIPALGLALLGPAALAADEPAQDHLAQDMVQERTAPLPPPGNSEPTGSVIDPDKTEFCRDRIIEAYGEDSDAQLQREPATPDEPLFFYAVDHELGGCDVLVMMNGEKRVPPPLPERPSLYRAQ